MFSAIHVQMTEQHNKNFTLSEAADLLRLTSRGVAKIARRYGLCMVSGRTLLFSEADIEGIKDTMRVAPAPPRPAPIKPALSAYQTHKNLVELSRKKSARK
ncbi:hypothetical protein [Mesorhizobium sp. B2-6-6]|uniref:hypothetical protein n=1 Tax=Mesorhizobium sp. B2-6-6 TaxID=2589911 RepID=UPI0015E3CC0F